MRIAFASTYPPMKCGIAVYTQKLARAMVEGLRDLEVVVIGEDGAGSAASEEERLRCVPTFRRGEAYAEAIIRAAVGHGVELVHFEHATDMFGSDARFLSVLAGLRERGIRTVVTLHTVNRDLLVHRLTSGMSTPRFHREVGRLADRVVLHQREWMVDRLEGDGVPGGKMVVIPHGTEVIAGPVREDARRGLGLPERAVVFLFFGFIHVQKNVHTAVRAFLRMAGEVPDAMLLVMGEPWASRWYNRAYAVALQGRVALAGMRHRVRFEERFIPAGEMGAVFSAADVVLLPHWQKYGSASGVFHQALGAGLPVLYARGPKFAEAAEAFAELPELGVPAGDVGAWALEMRRLARDPELRARAAGLTAGWAAKTAWPVVAARHVELYCEVITCT